MYFALSAVHKVHLVKWQVNAWPRMTMYFWIMPYRAEQPSCRFRVTGTDVTYLLWHTSVLPVCGSRWLLSLLCCFPLLQDSTMMHGWTLPSPSLLPGTGLPQPITWRSWACSRRQTPTRGKSEWAVHGVRTSSQVCRSPSREVLLSILPCRCNDWIIIFLSLLFYLSQISESY